MTAEPCLGLGGQVLGAGTRYWRLHHPITAQALGPNEVSSTRCVRFIFVHREELEASIFIYGQRQTVGQEDKLSHTLVEDDVLLGAAVVVGAELIQRTPVTPPHTADTRQTPETHHHHHHHLQQLDCY